MDDTLKARYTEVFEKQHFPEWSYRVPPPIPFVGPGFKTAPKRVLIYASAENLNHRDHAAKLIAQPDPMLRSSQFLAERRKQDPDSTFVHINPIDNRSLLLAARHVLYRIDDSWAFANDKPASFLDQIAVANPGKFSIDPDKIHAARKKNYDYAGDRIKFEEMRTYILADLKEIAPEIIIAPKSIADTLRRLTPAIDLAQGRRVVEVYQVSPQAINCHIKRQVAGKSWGAHDLPYAHWKVTDGRLNMNLYLQWLDQYTSLRPKA